jgi:hypothetical protein
MMPEKTYTTIKALQVSQYSQVMIISTGAEMG